MAENRIYENNISEDKKSENNVAEKAAADAGNEAPVKKTNKERLKEITDSIENGIKELFDSEKYKQYLQTMSRFHRYSVNNQMLIHMQNPNATLVAGFNKWRDQFGRNVMKGQKGIKIIAPTPFKKKIEETKLDPDTKLPMLDDKGNEIKVEKEIQIPMYRVVSVFDVSQTEGKPLPQLANDLTGNVQNYEVFLEAIKRSSIVPITFEPIKQADGYFSLTDQKIVIREGMSEVQTVSALLHEMAHSKLHNIKEKEQTPKNAEQSTDEQSVESTKLSRNTEEVQAESISFAVCAYYGIKTEDNSFGYIASWSKGKELSELRSSLEVINKTANDMINSIDKNYAEIRKERGLDNEKLELDEAMFENSINYLHIQKSDDAWDYSIYDKESLRLIDGGQIDNPDMKLEEIKEQILAEYEVKLPYGEPLPDSEKNRLLDDISEKALSQMSVDLPDPNITLADMNAYGYTYENMLPVSKDVAQKLFELDAPIYMLHYDNTESMVLDESEIKGFDGMFGIEKQDWDRVKDNYLKNAEMSVEDDYDMIDGIVNNGDNMKASEGKSVAELEADVKEGKSISLMELAGAIERESKAEKTSKAAKAPEEKPSLIAKLSRPLPPQQDKTQPKSKEREM